MRPKIGRICEDIRHKKRQIIRIGGNCVETLHEDREIDRQRKEDYIYVHMYIIQNFIYKYRGIDRYTEQIDWQIHRKIEILTNISILGKKEEERK